MTKPWLGPIRQVTVVTEDLPRSARAYRDHLGYELRGEGRIAEALAMGWAAPAVAGARYVVVGPSSGVGGAIRLVEGPIPEAYRPVRSFGWAALEVCVPDVDALAHQLTKSPFQILIPPAPLGGAAARSLRAMQVVGPSGEVIYFTEIRGPMPPFDLPTCSGMVDGVFITVAAAADLEMTRSWLETHFDVERASDRLVAVRVTNAGFGLPPDTTHRISSLKLRGQSAIEIDQYPRQAAARPTVPGFLPPGVASVSFDVASSPIIEPEQVVIGPDSLRVELISR